MTVITEAKSGLGVVQERWARTEIEEVPGAIRWNNGRLEQGWLVKITKNNIPVTTRTEWRAVPVIESKEAGQ